MNKVLLLIIFSVFISFSAPMNGMDYRVKQPDGTYRDIKYFGDEFYVTMETPDGYSLTEGDDGFLYFAELNSDSTAFIAVNKYSGNNSRSAVGVKHLRLNAKTLRYKINLGRSVLNRPSMEQSRENFVKRAPVSPRQSRAVTVDTIMGLTVLIDFPDQQSDLTKAQITDFVNKDGYSEFGNSVSVRDYFYNVSNGRWVYLNIVTDFYRAQYDKGHYDIDVSWMGTTAEAAATMKTVQSVMYEALESIKAAGFDFSKLSVVFSSDVNSNVFRAINFFYAGEPSYGWAKGLWPHQSALYTGDTLFSVNGVKAWKYQISPIKTSLSVGTFIHESGHVLCGYPDLYPYDQTSTNVLKGLDHMSYSEDNHNPIEFNSYFRAIMGWLNLTDISTLSTGLEYKIPNKGSAYVMHSHNGAESFYVENRRKVDGSSSLPGQGLMIWKIDTTGSNQEPTSTGGRYLVELVQADNLNQLGSGNWSDAGDFYNETNNSTFNGTSAPAANWNDGTFSGIDIRNISPSADTMTFTIGEKVIVPIHTLTVDSGTGGGDYQEGAVVAISATPPLGQKFIKWTGADSLIDDSTASDANITIGISDLTVTAVFDNIVSLNSLGSLETNSLAIKSISSNELSINIPTTGIYEVSIYRVNGRSISKFNGHLASGTNIIPLNADLGKGLFITEIVGSGGKLIAKSFIK